MNAGQERHAEAPDSATGLPRFTTAVADLGNLLRSGRGGRLTGIVSCALIVDPNHFRLSPDAIRRLRIGLTQQLQELLREQDQAYCINQREWILLLPDLVSPAALTLAMLRLQEHLFPLPAAAGYSGHQPRLAFGSAQWPDDGDDPLHLVQSARIARHLAETQGGPLAYRKEMDLVDASERAMLDELTRALQEQRGIALFLQPQFSLAERRCTGAEVLLRWQRDNGEWVAPQQVLDAVDRLGKRPLFLRWYLNRVAHTQRQLADAGIDLALSLNLAAHDLLDAELPDLIGQTLAIHDLSPQRLILEITETGMVAESLQVAETLERLRQMGLRLSIDDFGTGYAGMSYLQRLPVQEVKIDQMFVRQALSSTRARAIVASVIQLAGRLRLHVVGEGIENAETAALLAELGCHTGQGYWYSPPLETGEFMHWWQQQDPRQADSSGS